ncbi:OmpA family protein [Polynucleobacter antarcticus]|uniref:OmpA family protein n=1 Tax=Polynucleobacter antarcticus TaxID=1743162 RepID=UPI0020C5F964|nr:OmpA family protein [Polynucleobacter antarcticus]
MLEKTTTLVLDEFKDVKSNMQLALQNEFKESFKQWDAELLGDMTIRFNNPSVQFATQSSELRPEFQNMLRDFFPRYIKIIRSDKFKSAIKEIRIEGHTSKAWKDVSSSEAYFLNMSLSQERTRSTLRFIMSLPVFIDEEIWFQKHITANGLSSSQPIPNNPKPELNQRVEFRIVTNASDRLDQLIAIK